MKIEVGQVWQMRPGIWFPAIDGVIGDERTDVSMLLVVGKDQSSGQGRRITYHVLSLLDDGELRHEPLALGVSCFADYKLQA